MPDESWKYKELGALKGKPAQWNESLKDWRPFTGMSDVKDADVKTELEEIKQGVADNKATNDLILERLDGDFNTQLTGSIEGLSTDEKPTVIEGYSYLEYDVEAQEMNVYKGISGEWRLM